MTWNLFPLVIIAVVLFVVLNLAAGLIWVERRLLALWQDRYGPNRVGPFGLGQVVADSVKMFTKEDWVPPFADRPVFVLAPAIIVATALISFAVEIEATGQRAVVNRALVRLVPDQRAATTDAGHRIKDALDGHRFSSPVAGTKFNARAQHLK